MLNPETVNKDLKQLKKLTNLAKCQAPFPIILAKFGFNDPDAVYAEMLTGKYPDMFRALNNGRRQGLYDISLHQYQNAKQGRQKAIDNILLTRGSEMSDGFKSIKVQDTLAVNTPIVNDLEFTKLDKDAALEVLTLYVKGKVHLTKEQLAALGLIVKANMIDTSSPVNLKIIEDDL